MINLTVFGFNGTQKYLAEVLKYICIYSGKNKGVPMDFTLPVIANYRGRCSFPFQGH